MSNRIEDVLKKYNFENFIDANGSDIEKHYRTYFIKKKNGKIRQICAPDETLSNLQRHLSYFIKKLIKPHKCVAGFERGCSIKDNANRHRKANHILHMDICDFFPSITKEMFLRVYQQKLNKAECETLWKICSYNGGLPIGAPSSPFIANRIMLPLDKQLKDAGLFVKYSRYADDLVFSTKFRITENFSVKIKKVVTDFGFQINDKKTQFASSRKIVTGINITKEKKLTLGTAYKKRLKQNIYQLLKYNNGKAAQVKGEYIFLQMVEPAYAKILAEKYRSMDKIKFFY